MWILGNLKRESSISKGSSISLYFNFVSNYLLNTFCMPDTGFCGRETKMKKEKHRPEFQKSYSLVGSWTLVSHRHVKLYNTMKE